MTRTMPEHTAEITIEEIRRMVHDLDPSLDESDDAYQAAVVLLAGVQIGNRNTMKLAGFTGIPRVIIKPLARRLRHAGIWRSNGRTACDWCDLETGSLAFWLDVNVALGYLHREHVWIRGT